MHASTWVVYALDLLHTDAAVSQQSFTFVFGWTQMQVDVQWMNCVHFKLARGRKQASKDTYKSIMQSH